MSNQSMPWFRMYTDFLNDPKMIGLAFEDQRHFIGILALKSDGALDQDCCPDLMDRIVAQRLWIDHAVIREVKKRLVAAGLIDDEWQPLAWDKRQMRSDADPTNAERQRRYRQRQKSSQAPSEVEAESSQPTDNSENNSDRNGSNALRNAPVTPTDKDTDIDIDKKENNKNIVSNSRSDDAEFERFWLSYPNTSRRVAKRKCHDVWKKRKLNAHADEIIDHVRAMAKTKNWMEGYEPAPLTYLNQSRWEDGVPPDPSQTASQQQGAGYMPTHKPLNRQEALEAQNRQVAESWAARMQSEVV